jgi:serine/threonine protein kinase
MEHMHQDLQSYLEDGVNNSLVLSNLPIAMDIMLQIVGMQSMHQNGIAHRNFKSPHVLLNYPSQDEEMAKVGHIKAKVSLCCLSHIIDLHGMSVFDLQYHLGTTRWMALELIPNNTSHNMEIYNPFKVDVYSCAIICSKILTRVIQLAKIHVSKIKAMIKASARPTLPTSLPKFLLSLIEQCWDER